MSNSPPAIYILYGDDEFAIHTFVNDFKAKLGESASVDMNVSTLNGASTSVEKLTSLTHAMPFLSKRRMVILENPLALAKGASQRKKFLANLESIPDTTACVLKIERSLKTSHWLLKWAKAQGKRVFVKALSLPQGAGMTRWIQKQAQTSGGEFTNQGASRLAALVDENPRLADQEIEKLLAYVNYERPVTAEDVELLTPDVRPGDVFAMVDAISYKNGEKALRMLHRLLEENHPLQLYGMIIRQFRLLLQVKEMLNEDAGANNLSIAKKLGVHPYPIKKLIPQAKFFSLKDLEQIYHQLLEIDEAMKTGELEHTLALDMLIVALTT